jgi:hypothetical protein
MRAIMVLARSASLTMSVSAARISSCEPGWLKSRKQALLLPFSLTQQLCAQSMETVHRRQFNHQFVSRERRRFFGGRSQFVLPCQFVSIVTGVP